eukprot:8483695-Lingulodinium_polyedra.AAC.1
MGKQVQVSRFAGKAVAKGKAHSKKEPVEKDMEVDPSGMGVAGSNHANYVLAKLAKSGRPYPKMHYKTLKSWSAKRAFVEQLRLDPEASFLYAEEKAW